MTQEPLFHESIEDALRAAVAAMGGYKKVGAAMRPEMAADRAGNWLRDALSEGRREVLDPSQLLWLLRAARQAGYHGAMAFIDADCGYAPPQPVEPEDERAQLQRAFADSVRVQAQLVERMERLSTVQLSQVRRA